MFAMALIMTMQSILHHKSHQARFTPCGQSATLVQLGCSASDMLVANGLLNVSTVRTAQGSQGLYCVSIEASWTEIFSQAYILHGDKGARRAGGSDFHRNGGSSKALN